MLHKALLATDPLPKPMGDVIDHRFGRQHSVPSESSVQTGVGAISCSLLSFHRLVVLAAWLFDPLWVVRGFSVWAAKENCTYTV